MYVVFDVVFYIWCCVLYRPAEFLRTILQRFIAMWVLVLNQAWSHHYMYTIYRGRLEMLQTTGNQMTEMLQTTGNQLTKVRMRRSYLHSEEQRPFDKHLWPCILSTGFRKAMYMYCLCPLGSRIQNYMKTGVIEKNPNIPYFIYKFCWEGLCF